MPRPSLFLPLLALLLAACYPDDPRFFVSYELAPSEIRFDGRALAPAPAVAIGASEWVWDPTQFAIGARIDNRSHRELIVHCGGDGTFTDETGTAHPLQCIEGDVGGEIDAARLLSSPAVIPPGATRRISFVAAGSLHDWGPRAKRVRSILPSSPHRNVCCMSTDEREVEAVAARHRDATLTIVVPLSFDGGESTPLQVSFAVVKNDVRRIP